MTITAAKYTAKVRAPNCVRSRSIWIGGGAAADMTKSIGHSISTIAYNGATGKYIMTFGSVGEKFLGAFLQVLSATGGGYVAHPVAYSASAKTLTFEVYDMATPSAHDLTTAEQLWIDVEWADTDAP